uniref:Uncharacterized protein n=1 Tax=Romanomermis culicivorax TaxID=13658 RepID=A0A915I630_ROMCU
MPNAQGDSVIDDTRIPPSISATDASYNDNSTSSNSISPVYDSSETMETHAIGKPFSGPIDWHLAIVVGVVVCIVIISLFLLWLSYSRRRKNNTSKSTDKEDEYLMEAVPTGKGAQPMSCDQETNLKHAKKSSSMASVPSSGTPSSTDIRLGCRRAPRLKAVYICLPEQQSTYNKEGKEQQTVVANSTTKIFNKQDKNLPAKIKNQQLLKRQKFTIKDQGMKFMKQVVSNTPVKRDIGLKMNVRLLKTVVPNFETKLPTKQVKYKKKGMFAVAADAPDITLLANLKTTPKIVKNTV